MFNNISCQEQIGWSSDIDTLRNFAKSTIFGFCVFVSSTFPVNWDFNLQSPSDVNWHSPP